MQLHGSSCVEGCRRACGAWAGRSREWWQEAKRAAEVYPAPSPLLLVNASPQLKNCCTVCKGRAAKGSCTVCRAPWPGVFVGTPGNRSVPCDGGTKFRDPKMYWEFAMLWPISFG